MHDISDGGLLVALAEMAMAGNVGAELDPLAKHSPFPFLFGEDQGRYLLAVPKSEAAHILGGGESGGRRHLFHRHHRRPDR